MAPAADTPEELFKENADDITRSRRRGVRRSDMMERKNRRGRGYRRTGSKPANEDQD